MSGTPSRVRLERTSSLGAWATLRRGVQVSPQLVSGLWLTLLLALFAAALSCPLIMGRVDLGVAKECRRHPCLIGNRWGNR